MVVQTLANNIHPANMLKLGLEELKSIYDNPMLYIERYFKNIKFEIEDTLSRIETDNKKEESKIKLNEILNKLNQIELECASNYFKIKPIKEKIDKIENKMTLLGDKSNNLYDLIKQEKHDLKAILFSNRTIFYLDKNKCDNKFLFTEKKQFKLVIIKNEYLNPNIIDNLKNKIDNSTQKLTNDEVKLRLLEISIHLSKTHICEISSDVVDKSKFNLNGTELILIEDNSFQKCKSLKELNLSANKLDIITQNAFNGLNSLEFLHLSENLITSIESNSFRNFNNLKELNLNGCLLTSIRVNLFYDLVNLQILNLSDNKISVIEMNSFQKLANLQDLFLSRNMLIELPKKVFNGLTNLKMLNLTDNKLQSVDASAFKGMTKLKMLYMNRNPISNEFQYIFIRNRFKANFHKSNPDCKVHIEDPN